MRTMPLRFLTWGTIVAATGSAAWLASTDQAALFCSVGYRATGGALGLALPLPAEPAPAGASSGTPGAQAPKQLQASAG